MASSEKGTEEEENSNCCKIDRYLIAYKIHYFLLSGAHVGVIPYLPIYAKTTLGCSATTVGILSTCMQFSTTISKPLFGLLADCLNQMKILIAFLLALEVILNLLMLTLPPVAISSYSVIPDDANTPLRTAPVRVHDVTIGLHSPPKSHHIIPNSSPHKSNHGKVGSKRYSSDSSHHSNQEHSQLNTRNSSILQQHHQLHRGRHNYQCDLNCDSLISEAICQQNFSMCMETDTVNSLNCKLNKRKTAPFCEGFQTSYNFTIEYEVKSNFSGTAALQAFDLIAHSFVYYQPTNLKQQSFFCNMTMVSCSLRCQKPVRFCVEGKQDETNIYKTYQFWIFCLFALLGAMCQGAVYTLSDTVCYERLRTTTADYGRQRLWAAVGWGAIAPVSGYLNDFITGSSTQEDYTSGWYIMTILSFCFLINLYFMKFPKTKKSSSICHDMKGVLCNKRFFLMEANVFFIGILTAYTTNYIMWYMETLGSSSMQMGLALAVANLLGEVPFMYYSGWLISKLGHWNIVTLTFVAFAARFGAYYMLADPWLVLPVELIDGVTFGLFYTAMTSYGELMATSGTEATIQGILGGTYQGLAVALFNAVIGYSLPGVLVYISATGSGVGCLIAGISFDRFGGKRSFLLVSIVGACLALCHAVLYLICKPQKLNSDILSDSFVA